MPLNTDTSMELIYSTRRKPIKCEPPHFESATDPEVVHPICTISVANIIAFSSPTELGDTEGETWGGHVYVCDLDTPWDSHKVTTTVYPVSALEWDAEGKQLLITTTNGDVSIFGQKEHLLNNWTCLYTTNFPGEHIIKAEFFHNGRRTIVVDKKPDAPTSERIQVLRSTPTLKGFGGIACEGACVITSTGLVAVVALGGSSPSTPATVAIECLRAGRDHITTAAIAHKNGNLLIACVSRAQDASGTVATGARSAWGARACVRCYVCAVKRGTAIFRPPPPPAPVITVQSLPSIYLEDVMPRSITWCLREDTDSLLIAGSTLTLWKLSERSYSVHKLLFKGPVQATTTPGGGQKPPTDCFNTMVWQQTAFWPVEGAGRGAVIASCRLPLTIPHAVLVTPHALYLLSHNDSPHYICSVGVVTSESGGGTSPPAGASTSPKNAKYGPRVTSGVNCAVVSCADISWLGGVAVAVDTHAQLHVYKLPQWAEMPTPMVTVQHATTLMEYSMVSGYDCLDLILTLKPNVVEAVYERLTETFQRQPQSFQQHYYHSWLKLRIALCRALPSWQSSVSWLTCTQLVWSAWAASAASVRPDEPTRPEPAPAGALAPLAALLDDLPHQDHDKTLLALEAKTDLSSEAAALQPLRRPLQRALDIAVTVLAAAPHHHSHHGYELSSDPQAMSMLRKVCAAARACARGGDTLARLLARLTVAPKPELFDECAALAAQSPSPRVWESLPRCSVSAPHGRPWPLYFEYGVEPEALRYTPEPPPYAQCDTTPSSAMDSIRYMYLGGGGGGAYAARWRRCTRCGARAFAHALPAKHQRHYDARFLRACRCGGKWTLHNNV